MKQNTQIAIGSPNEAVIPDSAVSALIALTAPKVKAGSTIGEAWQQLLGMDVVKVDIRLTYDDGYGDTMTQEWCQGMLVEYDSTTGRAAGVTQTDCKYLPELLARQAAR